VFVLTPDVPNLKASFDFFAAAAAVAADAATLATGVGVGVGVGVGMVEIVPAGLKPVGNDAHGTEMPPVELEPVDEPIFPMLAMSGPGFMRLRPLMTRLMPSIAVLIIVFKAPKTFEIRFKNCACHSTGHIESCSNYLADDWCCRLDHIKKGLKFIFVFNDCCF
jgi:hypothetical protein